MPHLITLALIQHLRLRRHTLVRVRPELAMKRMGKKKISKQMQNRQKNSLIKIKKKNSVSSYR